MQSISGTCSFINCLNLTRAAASMLNKCQYTAYLQVAGLMAATKQGDPLFGAAVLIIRNPLNALVAEWKRQKTVHTHAQPHVAGLGKEYFGRFIAFL